MDIIAHCFHCRSLRTQEKRIHRQLYLAMIIQIIVRLILYTDQYISRPGLSLISNSGGTSQDGSGGEGGGGDGGNTSTADNSHDNDGRGAQNSIHGIDNTVWTLQTFILNRTNIYFF